jgi:hypothetical protein
MVIWNSDWCPYDSNTRSDLREFLSRTWILFGQKIDAAFGHQQVGDPGGVARSIRCGAYGNRPRLAPKRLTGYITC